MLNALYVLSVINSALKSNRTRVNITDNMSFCLHGKLCDCL